MSEKNHLKTSNEIDISGLSKPLLIKDIEFRVGKINKGKYVTILAYKNARVDMERLDAVVGALNWRREHTRENHNCIVSIYDASKKEWVGKEDTGTESYAESEKGLASDSFKRACFNWGIGRELYRFPLISFKLNDNEVKEHPTNGSFKASWALKLKYFAWYGEFKNDKINFLACLDTKGIIRFEWGIKQDGKPVTNKDFKNANKPFLTKADIEKALKAIRDYGKNKEDLKAKDLAIRAFNWAKDNEVAEVYDEWFKQERVKQKEAIDNEKNITY